MAGSLKHLYLALTFLTFPFCEKRIPALAWWTQRYFTCKQKNAVCMFPGCEFCLSSDKACRGCVFREGCQRYLQGCASLLRLYQAMPQISIFQAILLWRYRWYSKTKCPWEQIPWIFDCSLVSTQSPGPFWGVGWPTTSLLYVFFYPSKARSDFKKAKPKGEW